VTRDDQNWLAQQQADNRPPDHTATTAVLLVVGFVALFWCAACAWTIKLI
jgi:hypothetical protein